VSCRLGGRKDGQTMSDRCVAISSGVGDKLARCAADDNTYIVTLSIQKLAQGRSGR
jgi:hypothetical protein